MIFQVTLEYTKNFIFYSRYFSTFQNTSEYFKVLQDIPKYYRIFQGTSEYLNILQILFNVLREFLRHFWVCQNTSEYFKVLLGDLHKYSTFPFSKLNACPICPLSKLKAWPFLKLKAEAAEAYSTFLICLKPPLSQV